MAKITFERGDIFSFGKSANTGFGLVINNGSALLISGSGGRTGFNLKKVDMVPDDALPTNPTVMRFEIQFAMKAICIAMGLPNKNPNIL